jgi:succinate dehydrogenase/fumarate reductase cytochrome b subunit
MRDFLLAIRAVLWSFLGIRSSKGYDHDRAKLKLWQIVVAALVCVLMFVLSLFFLVRFLTAK